MSENDNEIQFKGQDQSEIGVRKVLNHPGQKPPPADEGLGDIPMLKYREEKRSKKNVVFFGLVAMAMAGVGVYIFNPGLYYKAKLEVMSAVDRFYDTSAPVRESEKIAEREVLQSTRASTSVCGTAIRKFMTGGRKYQRVQKNRLIFLDCLLFQGQPQKISATSPFGKKPFRKLKNDSLGEEYILLVLGYLHSWKAQSARALAQKKCVKWHPSAYCVGRLLTSAFVGAKSQDQKGYQILASSPAAKPFRAYTEYAGALIDVKMRRFKQALQKVKRVSQLSKNRYFVRKLAFDLRAEIGYLTRNNKLISSGLSLARKSLPKDPGVLGVVKMFQVLGNRNATGNLKSFLENTYEYPGVEDVPRYIDYVAPQALALDKKGLALQYLDRLKKSVGRKYFVTRVQVDQNSHWYLRAQLGALAYRDGLQTLERTLRQNPKDADALHLGGLLLLYSSPLASVQLKAAVKFQEAAKIKERWQSLYGLGVALVGAGKIKKLNYVLQRLESHAKKNKRDQVPIRVWKNLLVAETDISSGKAKRALNITKRIVKRRPGIQRAWHLKLSALSALGRKEAAFDLRRQIMELGPPSPKTYRTYGDPLGALVFLRP